MNRPLKFRFWNCINNRWVEAYSILLNKGEVWAVEDKKVDVENHDIHQVVIQQFTGVIDKNGKEIFEGDIIIDRWLRERKIKRVCWHGYYWNPFSEFYSPDEDGDRYEVIGNIYENPELVEEKADEK